jgi:hypothetical protein
VSVLIGGNRLVTTVVEDHRPRLAWPRRWS